MDDFELVRELAYMFETNPDALITAALERHVPARDIIAAYMRTLRYLREHGVEGASNAPITDLDARPPGTFDPRIVFNTELWIDIFRRPWRVNEEMSPDYAQAVIDHLHFRVRDLYEVVGPGGDPHEWLDQTPLVQALRRRSDRSGMELI
jgi:hypothetical protein